MNIKDWRISLMAVVVTLFGVLAIRFAGLSFSDHNESLDGSPQSTVEPPGVTAYFPARPNTVFEYVGTGQEFATFTRRITHVMPGYLQMEDSSGTNLVQIVELNAEHVRVLWSQEEFYEERNLLESWEQNQVQSQGLVLLRAPLEIGFVWNDERFEREIIGIGEKLAVSLGSFHDVVVVKSVPYGQKDSVHYEWYAKNVGLIRRKTVYYQAGESWTYVSDLHKLQIGF